MFETRGWVRLSPGEDARIREGHLWVYRNEIKTVGGGFEDGDVVSVEDARGRKIGTGFANLASLIAVRLLTQGSSDAFDEGTFIGRLEAAFDRRRHLPAEAVRLVNAEGDLLPGLVVDRYRDIIVVQAQSLGWERRLDLITGALKTALAPRAIVLKHESMAREAEGLERYTRVVEGDLDGNVLIQEAGLELEVDILGGQKTGFYIDQRENRKLVLPYTEGHSVLDCFCYTGTWSLLCAHAGARSIVGIDSSEASVALAERNAVRNRSAGAATFETADVFDRLPEFAASRTKFDIIILDPPSMAKARKALRGAERGYIHLNRLAMGLLSPGGMLLTCSCSHHMPRDAFLDVIRRAAVLARKRVRLLRASGQPEDHPSLVGVPETDYLKCFLLQVE